MITRGCGRSVHKMSSTAQKGRAAQRPVGFRFNNPEGSRYNIRRACCVCKDEMARKYCVKGSLPEGPVLFFVNRSNQPGRYALDESFSREEATCLARLLQSRNLECRVREFRADGAAGQPASWNLLGRLIELDQSDGDLLSFPVVGCLEG